MVGEGREQLERAIAIRRKLAPGGSTSLANAMGWLALTLQSMGRLESADSLLRDAYAMASRTAGAEAPETISILDDMAQSRQKLGAGPGRTASIPIIFPSISPKGITR